MELADYQVEAPHTVRLFYKNGRQKVVTESELAVHLAPLDVLKVQQALQLRQAYFRELPKWVKLMLIVVLAASVGYGGVKAAPGIRSILHELIPAIPTGAVSAPTQSQAAADVSAAPKSPQPVAESRQQSLPQPEVTQPSPANVQLPQQASVQAVLNTVNRVSPLRLPTKLPAAARTPF